MTGPQGLASTGVCLLRESVHGTGVRCAEAPSRRAEEPPASIGRFAPGEGRLPLDFKLVNWYMCRIQDGTRIDPAGAPASNLGRETCRCRPQAIGSQGWRPAPHPASTSRAPPAACDAACPGRAPVVARGPHVFHRPAEHREGIARRPPDPRVLGPARSRPSPRRGGGDVRALARTSRPHHPDREGSQPDPRSARSRLERPISCPGAPDAAGGPECAGLCVAELAEARPRRARRGWTVVGRVVRWLADAGSAAWGELARGSPADLARGHRLATARVARSGGGAGLTAKTLVAASNRETAHLRAPSLTRRTERWTPTQKRKGLPGRVRGSPVRPLVEPLRGRAATRGNPASRRSVGNETSVLAPLRHVHVVLDLLVLLLPEHVLPQ